jgi:tetratricopeptide (TPR) repeat protein
MKRKVENEGTIPLEIAYRNALRKAWEDGRISYDERSLIKQFTEDLPLPKEVLSMIEAREYLRFRWNEYETSSYEHQMKVVEKLLDIDEENLFLWMKKGSLLFRRGEIDNAIGALDRGLELDPTSHETWFWKGSAFVNKGDLGAAQDCFEKALEQDPDHTLSWLMLGRVERRQGNLEKAKACSTRAIECCPDHPMGYVERALTLLELGSKEEARLDLEKALDMDPLNEIALT